MEIDLKVFIVPQIRLDVDVDKGMLIINKAVDEKRHRRLVYRATEVTKRLARYSASFTGQFFEDNAITMSTEDREYRFQFAWRRETTPGMMEGKILLHVSDLNERRETPNAKARSANR